jgi:hypothetical protein
MLSAQPEKGQPTAGPLVHKRTNRMNYTKPEVVVLDKAVRVIEAHIEGLFGVIEFGRPPLNRGQCGL